MADDTNDLLLKLYYLFMYKSCHAHLMAHIIFTTISIQSFITKFTILKVLHLSVNTARCNNPLSFLQKHAHTNLCFGLNNCYYHEMFCL